VRGHLVSCLAALLAACDAPPTDVVRPDASLTDAPLPPDAAPVDAGPGRAGEPCRGREPFCADALHCQWLQTPAEAICTRVCRDEAECADLGAGACCAAPGVHDAYLVCTPAAYCP
jgi:hypothetical protein